MATLGPARVAVRRRLLPEHPGTWVFLGDTESGGLIDGEITQGIVLAQAVFLGGAYQGQATSAPWAISLIVSSRIEWKTCCFSSP